MRSNNADIIRRSVTMLVSISNLSHMATTLLKNVQTDVHYKKYLFLFPEKDSIVTTTKNKTLLRSNLLTIQFTYSRYKSCFPIALIVINLVFVSLLFKIFNLYWRQKACPSVLYHVKHDTINCSYNQQLLQ